MNAVILTCSSLTEHINAAQKNCQTDHKILIIDRSWHSDPDQMKVQIAKIIHELPQEIDTVLVAMGFCGGTWDHVSFDKTIVIPRVDDCVSLLLHTDDGYHPNLKEPGHLYLYENDPKDFSALSLMKDASRADPSFKDLDPEYLNQMLFGQYRYMDIIDTGLNDCYDENYVYAAQEQADAINAALDYTSGSIRILEKLVSGKWDSQFIVAKPGQIIKHGDFF